MGQGGEEADEEAGEGRVRASWCGVDNDAGGATFW